MTPELKELIDKTVKVFEEDAKFRIGCADAHRTGNTSLPDREAYWLATGEAAAECAARLRADPSELLAEICRLQGSSADSVSELESVVADVLVAAARFRAAREGK